MHVSVSISENERSIQENKKSIPDENKQIFIDRAIVSIETNTEVIVHSVNDISGRFVAIWGENGSGKNALFKNLIRNDLLPYNGTLMYIAPIDKHMDPNPTDDGKVIELLLSKVQQDKLRSKYYNAITKTGKIVIILQLKSESNDPKYIKKVNSILYFLKKKTKISKVVVTLNSYQVTLDVDKFYRLKPLTSRQQILFMSKLAMDSDTSWKSYNKLSDIIDRLLRHISVSRGYLKEALGYPKNLKRLFNIFNKLLDFDWFYHDMDLATCDGWINLYQYTIENRVGLDLLQSTFKNDMKAIRKIHQENSNLFYDNVFEPPFAKSLLAIALDDFAQAVEPETVRFLITLGANVCQKDANNDYIYVRDVVKGQNPELIHLILEKLPMSDKVSTIENMIIALLGQKNRNYKPFFHSIYQLVKEKYEIELVYRLSYPILAAIDKLNDRVTVLDYYASCSYGKTWSIRESEVEQIENLHVSIKGLKYNVINDKYDELILYVQMGHDYEEHIIESIKRYNKDADFKDIVFKILKTAFEEGMSGVVKAMMTYCKRYLYECEDNLVEIAAREGYYKIFKIIVHDENIEMGENILVILLDKLKTPPIGNKRKEYSNYEKCLQLLLCRRELNPNYVQDSTYLLEYVNKYCGSDTVLATLNRGASLANKNIHYELIINGIAKDVLKEHFNACIEKSNDTIENVERPALPNSSERDDPTKNRNCNVLTFNYETLFPSDDACKLNEHVILQYLRDNIEFQDLLKHPLINSFLHLKWNRVKWVLYYNLFCYLIMFGLLFSYALAYYYYHDEISRTWLFITKLLLCIAITVIILRELIQSITNFKKYICNFENYIDLAFISIIIAMFSTESASDSTKKQLCSVCLIVTAFEIIFLIGNFDTFSLYVTMFRRVSLNFFRYITAYILLIFAFSLAFQTLFQQEIDEDLMRYRHNAEEGTDYFDHFIYAFLKIIVMMTGEFEAGDFDLRKDPIASYFVFLAFVLSITIILFNLLNGLAVGDTQDIKGEVTLINLKKRVDYIHYGIIVIKLSKKLFKRNILYSELLKNNKYVYEYNGNGKIKMEIIKSAEKICNKRQRNLKLQTSDSLITLIARKLEKHDKLLGHILNKLNNQSVM